MMSAATRNVKPQRVTQADSDFLKIHAADNRFNGEMNAGLEARDAGAEEGWGLLHFKAVFVQPSFAHRLDGFYADSR